MQKDSAPAHCTVEVCDTYTVVFLARETLHFTGPKRFASNSLDVNRDFKVSDHMQDKICHAIVQTLSSA